MVSPNGKEIFGKQKEFVEIRKKLMETCNLTKISYLPSQSFKPYTGVETLTLFFTKGTPTKEVKFVNIIKNKDDSYSEKEIAIVKIKEFANKKYSWNAKDYVISDLINFDGIEHVKLKDMCIFLPNGKRKSKEGKNTGKYPLFYCSILGHLYMDDYDFHDENIIMNTTNGNGKCEIFYYDGEFSTAENTIRFKSSSEKIKTYYIYAYLKLNKNIIESLFNGVNQKQLSREDFKNIEIPVPSLEVQQLIVKELDNLHKTKDNITKLLESWSYQKMVKFNNLINGCEKNKKNKLGDICEIDNGKRIVKDKINEGIYPVYGGGDISFYTDTYNRDIINCKISREGMSVHNCVMMIKGKFYLNSQAMTIKSNDSKKVKSEFIWNFLVCNKDEVYNCGRGSAQRAIDVKQFENILIRVPSRQDQERIVTEMEKDDATEQQLKDKLTELDITIKKRFEYYLQKCAEAEEAKSSKSSQTSTNEPSDESEEDIPKKQIKVIKKANTQKKKVVPDSDSETSDDEEKEPPKKTNIIKKANTQKKQIVPDNSDSSSDDMDSDAEDKKNTVITKKKVIKK